LRNGIIGPSALRGPVSSPFRLCGATAPALLALDSIYVPDVGSTGTLRHQRREPRGRNARFALARCLVPCT
jgi:hypothetical protein